MYPDQPPRRSLFTTQSRRAPTAPAAPPAKLDGALSKHRQRARRRRLGAARGSATSLVSRSVYCRTPQAHGCDEKSPLPTARYRGGCHGGWRAAALQPVWADRAPRPPPRIEAWRRQHAATQPPSYAFGFASPKSWRKLVCAASCAGSKSRDSRPRACDGRVSNIGFRTRRLHERAVGPLVDSPHGLPRRQAVSWRGGCGTLQ